MEAVSELSKELHVVGMHVFALRGTADGSEQIPVRNFAPLYGIDEESATGTSNCALACALLSSGCVVAGTQELTFAQGHCMDSPSRIAVRLPANRGGRPWVD